MGGLGSLFLVETYEWAVVVTGFSFLPPEELVPGKGLRSDLRAATLCVELLLQCICGF